MFSSDVFATGRKGSLWSNSESSYNAVLEGSQDRFMASSFCVPDEVRNSINFHACFFFFEWTLIARCHPPYTDAGFPSENFGNRETPTLPFINGSSWHSSHTYERQGGSFSVAKV